MSEEAFVLTGGQGWVFISFWRVTMFADLAKVHANKKYIRAVLALILICIIMGAGWFAEVSKKEKNKRVTITSMSIDGIAEKFHHEGGYYLTVVLEDWLLETYHLSYDRVSFRTEQKIYDNVVPGDNFTGICLKITEPDNRSKIDLGFVLKREQNDLCEIISVTTAENAGIDET